MNEIQQEHMEKLECNGKQYQNVPNTRTKIIQFKKYKCVRSIEQSCNQPVNENRNENKTERKNDLYFD